MRFGLTKSKAQPAAANGRWPAVLAILLRAFAVIAPVIPDFRIRIGRTVGKLCAVACFMGVLFLLGSTQASWAQSADLSVTKTAPATVAPGQNITYTLTVSNAGPDAAVSTQLTDTVPAGTTFVSMAQNSGPAATLTTPAVGGTGNVTATWATLASGATATFTLTVNVNAAAPAGSVVTNTATVTSTTADPNPVNNTSTATTTVTAPGADLSVTKTAPATAVPGQNLAYTLTVSNTGPDAAVSTQLTDTVPAGTTFVSMAQNSGPAATLTTPAVGGTGAVTATWATLASGATATFTLTANVNAAVPTGSVVTNTATVTSTTSDPSPANNAATVSSTVVTAGATNTTLTSSVNPSTFGQSVTFTATVAKSGGSGTPTGTVTFKDGATTLGTVPLSGATASFTTSSLAVGNHSITATYNGDGSFSPSTSPALTQTVNPAGATTATTTTLASSVNPSNTGQPVTFTATVAPTSGAGTPTGNVTFTDGATALGTGTLSGGQATFTTSSLSAGNHTITATYNGDANFSPSTSPPLTQAVNQPATTTTTLASSVNPSNVGQAVTFTATVTSSAGTPSGTVTFKDGATVIGTATLAAGAAAFTTSSLTLGTHTITATYGGTAGFAVSTSPAMTQTVQIPPDSVRLRALQVAVSKTEALASAGAFEGAVAGAIADGFAEGGGALITPTGTGVRFNFAAEPDASLSGGRVAEQYDSVLAARGSVLRDSGLSAMNQNLPASVRSFAPDPSAAGARVDDAFTALAYAKPMATKAPPLVPAAPKEWLLWADVRGTGWNTDPSAGDIRGGQINAIAGLTRKLTPDFLIGILGGYENFDYTSQTLNGRLKGDGWTVGGYLGWRIWPGVRFDAALGRSGVSYDGVSGTAAASFPGNRWIASAGLTGMYRMQWLDIEPSAKVFAVWERDSSYIDSLGTLQAENTFSSGRASSGVKVAYPLVWGAMATLAPYVGLYADYYFSSDNAALLLPTQFVQGWAARTTAGVSYNVAGGAKVLVGGEVGGLGSQNFTTWSVRGRASLPF
jgi:uncharacterized repeat protein (TIGR01451 family)